MKLWCFVRCWSRTIVSLQLGYGKGGGRIRSNVEIPVPEGVSWHKKIKIGGPREM